MKYLLRNVAGPAKRITGEMGKPHAWEAWGFGVSQRAGPVVGTTDRASGSYNTAERDWFRTDGQLTQWPQTTPP